MGTNTGMTSETDAIPPDLDEKMGRFVSSLAVGRSITMQQVRYVEMGDTAVARVEGGDTTLAAAVGELRRRLGAAGVDRDGAWLGLFARDVALAATAHRMAREAIGT